MVVVVVVVVLLALAGSGARPMRCGQRHPWVDESFAGSLARWSTTERGTKAGCVFTFCRTPAVPGTRKRMGVGAEHRALSVAHNRGRVANSRLTFTG